MVHCPGRISPKNKHERKERHALIILSQPIITLLSYHTFSKSSFSFSGFVSSNLIISFPLKLTW